MTIESDIGILSTKIGHIDEAVSGMNKNVNIILEKLDHQNGDLIRAKKDIETLQSNIGEIKERHLQEIKTLKDEYKEQDDNIWGEIRRSQKKTMWVVGVMITVGMGLVGIISSFLN